MKLLIKKGTTNKRIQIFIPDSSSSTGAGLTGLTNLSAGLTAYYFRDGDSGTGTSISLSDGTVGTYSSGGFKQISSANLPGVYELGLPDAAIASGSNHVMAMLKGATNMAPVLLEIQLTDFDLYSATVSLASDGLSASVLATDAANEIADAVLDRANGVETSLTPRQALKLIAAASAGKISGATTTTVTIRNAVADSKDRIVATVDGNGNRTAITYDTT